MKNLFIAAVICIAATYGVDAIWFNGQYYNTVTRLVSNISLHFR